MGPVEVLRTPEECFGDLTGFPYSPRHVNLPDGLQMHYVDEGPPGAETILLLHGQPTWSYLYRTVVARLTEHGLRAVAPDLIGFGRSDKPMARAAHTVRAHVEWIAQFTEDLGLDRVTLVGQDWGGPIGLGLLRARPGLVRRVVAANTALHTADPALSGRLTWACHAGADGTITVQQALLDYQRLTQEISPLRPSLFVQGATASVVPDEVLAAYDAPFPYEPFCAGPRQLPLLMGLTPTSPGARLNRHTMDALARFEGPLVTAFSDGDPGTRGWDEVLQAQTPGARSRSHVTLPGAGHFLQEDCGPALADVVAGLVAETPAA